MPRGGWLTYFRPQAGPEIPASFRLIVAAVSGATLSLSYTGLYLSIYSWVCVGILLLSLFGARPRVAFACGFLHGLLFVLTALPWIATVLAVHGGVSPASGWSLLLLIAVAWGILTGAFAWSVHRLSLQSIDFACLGAPFLWVTFEFARAHLPEIGFPWNLLGYPATANLGLVQLATIAGIYGLSFLAAGFNALPTWTGACNTLAIRFGHPFLAGAVEWKPPVDTADSAPRGSLRPYNSALLFDAQGRRVFVYDKVHLVPFGEYEPFPLIHRLVASVSGQVGGFHKGNKYVVGQLPGGNTFGVFICYEAIFPGEVRHFAANGAQVLINISNDGWFGRSAAAGQHLRMGRVRAVENRRWLVRATNNGFTVSVDPYGRVFEPIPPDIRAAADLPYDFRTDETIYTSFGDWFAWLCVLVSVILVAGTFRKAK